MDDPTRKIISELEQEAVECGLVDHLVAARELARDGVAIETMGGMLRYVFTKEQMEALIAEANGG